MATPRAVLSSGSAVIGGCTETKASILAIQTIALAGATLTVEGSLDEGTTWNALLMMPWGSATGVTSATATGAWRVDIAGIPLIRINSSGGTSTTYYVFVNG